MTYNRTMDSSAPSIALTDLSKGLTQEYVLLNTSQTVKGRQSDASIIIQTIRNQLVSVFFILLLASAYLCFWLGYYIDAAIFLSVNVINVVVGFIQEYRASKASKTLEDAVHHSVTVLRDGTFKQIKDTELIVGDILLLTIGHVLPADVLVREAFDAYADESMHTGQVMPVFVDGGRRLRAGASVLSGRVLAQVIVLGKQNALVKYSTKLKDVKKQDSFAKFISKINFYVLVTTLLGLTVVAVFSVFLTEKYTADLFVLFAVAVLVGVVPESLSLVITLMLTREALVLSRNNVIVKKLSALQLLGSIKYLLVNKTGNITTNEIKVADTVDINGLQKVATRIALAEYKRTSMDQVFDDAIRQRFSLTSVGGIPLELIHAQDTPEIVPYKGSVGYIEYDFKDITIVRGQFRKVVDLCNYHSADLDNAYVAYELHGLRVVALATSTDRKTFSLSGLLIFEDSLKSDAAASYAAVQDFGIDTKVITGDSPLVATYVAQQLDSTLDGKNVCALDSVRISQLSEEEIAKSKTYARCQPEDRFELINKHAAYGAVGFVSDAADDVLALRRADVGIVINTANDTAIQSADILITEKGLGPVASAIQMSRRVYTQIYTYLLCSLAGNIGLMFSLVAVALFWDTLPMLPVQILLNNLLTDIPLIFIITDHLTKYQYNKPADHTPWPFFRTIIIFSLITSCFDLIYFLIFYTYPIEVLRTGWFVLGVLMELVLVLSLRTRTAAWKGRLLSLPLTVVLVLGACAALALPYIPEISELFSFVPINSYHIGVIVSLVVIFFAVNESVKKFIGKFASIS